MKKEKQIANYLLQSKAIKLETANPFTWASGWKSPIYCDNRKTLSYPEIRDYIRDEFANTIKKEFPNVEVIAGVATGAIAQGVLVAQALNLPFIYVRPSAKEHGLGNQIEGVAEKGKKVVVIEDLISTGGSSLKAVATLRKEDMQVLGMCAIFTYGFQKAVDNFTESNCKLITLSNYDALIDLAVELNYIKENQVEILKQWRIAPEKWGTIS